MFKKLVAQVVSALFLLETTISSYPALASSRLNDPVDARGEKQIVNELVLDRHRMSAQFLGLELSFSSPPLEGARFKARIECFGLDATPALAIDSKVYGKNAQLINVTDKSQFSCNSYQVDIAAAGEIKAGQTKQHDVPHIAVSITSSVPSSFGEGASVFVFNPVHGNWTNPHGFHPADASPNRAYATLTEQHQRIISGVIVNPNKSATPPIENNSVALSDALDAIKPDTGYLSLGSLTPDSKGTLSKSLPLFLRPSRGAGPSFSIDYSSNGAAGVLGRGWDLAISSVSVRGPGPIYHPEFETEDYLLDGQELVAVDAIGKDVTPLYKGGPIIPRIKGQRIFRLRNNSQGLIIRRFGGDPNRYYWLVWNPHTGITRLYGGHRGEHPSMDAAGFEQPEFNDDRNGILSGSINFGGPSSTLTTSRNSIGQWGLTQEYDRQPAKNGSAYFYNLTGKECDRAWGEGAPCSPALRLDEAIYNLSFGLTLKSISTFGVTRVHFDWRKRNDYKRFNSDGRLGFLRAHEYWLNYFEVRYQSDGALVSLTSGAVGDKIETFNQVFSTHSFELTDDDPCTNFETLLATYSIVGNPSYDTKSGSQLQKQNFNFEYQGKGRCQNVWDTPQSLNLSETSDQLKKAPGTSLGFPSHLLDSLGLGALTDISLLGTTQSSEVGSAIYVGVGPLDDITRKPISVGLKLGSLQTKSETGSTLIDVTGDGIADIVYKLGDKLRYCGGRRIGTAISYPSTECGGVDVGEVVDLGRGSTSAESVGFEAYAGNAFVGIGSTAAENQTYVYFTDRDGDGLSDIVAYGRVYYGLGKDPGTNNVRFASNKSLTPPLPGGDDKVLLDNRVPQDLNVAIASAARKLEATTEKLKRLDYSQSTISWEAPFDGRIRLDGSLDLDLGKFDPEIKPGQKKLDPEEFDPGKYDPGKLGLGTLDFPTQKHQADLLREYFYNCDKRPFVPDCYASASEPYAGHYDVPEGAIDFIDTPPAYIQIAVSRKADATNVFECAFGEIIEKKSNKIEDLKYSKLCNQDIEPVGSEIYVHTGDVIYLTYSIAPDFKANITPAAKIAYEWVENDSAFNFTTGAQADTITHLLNCGWSDQGKEAPHKDCLLRAQTRYTYDLMTATLPSAPGQAVVLRTGSHRLFGGKFEIPTAMTKDYEVYFDIFAAPYSDDAILPAEYPLIFRQNVSDNCSSAVGETCIVDVTPICAPAAASKDCADFFSPKAQAIRLTSRFTIEHKNLPGFTARNLSSRLARLKWRVPPHVSSEIKEDVDSKIPARPSEASLPPQLVKVFLPVSMGDEDNEFARIDQGLFPNPNPDLNESSSTKTEINFREILTAERDNVAVTRNRQTQRLCGFATEIIDFLEARATEFLPPYAPSYSEYWRERQTAFQPRCREAEQALYELSFTTSEDPNEYVPRLNLPRLLRNLPVAQQTSSAESLLDRVFRNLELPRELLTDDFKITRRGYRLPAKVNPLDCGVMTSNAEPIDKPIFGDEGHCKFRILSNFAMADLNKLIGEEQGKDLVDLLEQIYQNPAPAFTLDLSATVNGEPVKFRELSGANEAGNLPCDAPKDTCLGNYGSFDRLEQHVYPDVATGEMFQRIVTNRRAGRAVAFSDDIMRVPSIGVCITPERQYSDQVAMEAKQDCPQPGLSLPDDKKYVQLPGAKIEAEKIEYTILENNRFAGRNRVLEFDAQPLDVLELHFSLKPVTRTAQISINHKLVTVRGNFSVLDVGQDIDDLYHIKQGKYLIPRSPFDLLSAESKSPSCPRKSGADHIIRDNCRPWSKLGWTEVLLGAQYRTLSDAHRTSDEFSYSIRRRREVLRIQPEIEVPAESYFLNVNDKIPTAEELYAKLPQNIVAAALEKGVRLAGHPVTLQGNLKEPLSFVAMLERYPNVAKIGADWGLFAERHAKDGKLVLPPGLFNLRFGAELIGATGAVLPNIDTAMDLCGNHGPQPPAKGFYNCKTALAEDDAEQPTFDKISIIPLVHRFVGAVSALPDATQQEQTVDEGALWGSPCVELPARRSASCWKGPDDTIFAERGLNILGKDEATPFRSVSALVGFEHPPIVRFVDQFDALCRLLLAGPDSKTVPGDACRDHKVGSGADTDELAAEALTIGKFPNRPLTPTDRVIEVFAPVQSSNSETMSLVAGIDSFNALKSWTAKSTRQLFLDVNGDGYPDTVTNGVAELSSPVGLSRRDWWRYFRVEPDASTLRAEASIAHADQSSDSSNAGVGAGLSPSTFAKSPPKGTQDSKYTGSPNGAVEPSFDLSFEKGQDDRLTDLKDFNGDGLADTIEARKVSGGLSVALNAGSRLTSAVMRSAPAVSSIGGFVHEDNFNTSHSAGFGVRLGYSYASGSLTGGMGLAHKDSTSEGALTDFNADGRVDVVLPVTRDGKNYLALFPNLGNGYDKGRLYEITGWEGSESSASETTLADAGVGFTWGIGIPLIGIKIVFNPSTKKANDQTRELLQIRDMDADGAPDIVTVSGRFKSADGASVPNLQRSSLKTQIHRNPDARYYLLRTISEPSGKRHFLSFGLFGNTGAEHGTSVWALTSVATFDGYEPVQVADATRLSPDGQDIDLTLYDYAKGYYNRAERQFYGFSHRIVRKYGCDIGSDTAQAGARCIDIITSGKTLTQPDLTNTAFKELQVSIQTYSNLDYLTQGMLLSQTTLGFDSGARLVGSAVHDDIRTAALVSQSQLGYTIDNLSTLSGDDAAVAPGSLDVKGSKLPPIWDGTRFINNGSVLGADGICKNDVRACAQTLELKMFDAGFGREQTAFWSQQPGAVRQRFELLQAPGDDEQIQQFLDTDRIPQLKDTPRLTSAIAIDHDQWGQVQSFASIGEMLRDGTPIKQSSIRAEIGYAKRQGPNSRLGTDDESVAVGYPLLDLPEAIELYPGFLKPTENNNEPPIRAREALYANDGTGNLTDVCSYPGGEGFRFSREGRICKNFKASMSASLQDGYSTLESALRGAYAEIPGLPKGEDQFDAIIHEQITGYDPYGNITHVVSPLSSSKEWLERRFDYSLDPFLTSPTSIEATRCVEDVPGAGADSKGLVAVNQSRCAFGLTNLNSAVERKSVTHFSRSRIDPYFGMVAETEDINGNSLLFDHDRWGRLRLIARSWGNEPRENQTFKPWIDVAMKKAITSPAAGKPTPDHKWRILAITDFGRKIYSGNGFENSVLRSSIRRFEPSANYNGLLPQQNTTRETAAVSDAAGQIVQTIQEADVCLGALGTILDGINPGPKVDLASRCERVATGYVVPGPATDALGREWQTFEPYAIGDTGSAQSSGLRFEDLEYRKEKSPYVTDTVFDAASRPSTVENRLSEIKDTAEGKRLVATTQYRYRVLDQQLAAHSVRPPRLEALSLTPRCTASSTWSDARGLTTDVFEDQLHFYGEQPNSIDLKGANRRDYEKSLAKCRPIESMIAQWTADSLASEISNDLQPSRVSYEYDPLRQLFAVNSPLEGDNRSKIYATYDQLGRMTEMREPNAGCVRYHYDGLQNLTSEIASRYQPDSHKTCDDVSKVKNEKLYRYSADRLLEMSYRSLEEQGGAKDQADKVRFFYDRFPYSATHGELIEALKFVPNDLANQRFVDQTGLVCENCTGKVSIVADRSGATSQTYNELGLPVRQVRSIVGPIYNSVKRSDGESETVLPELAFYELRNAYTTFGDLSEHKFTERAPMNPSYECLQAGVETCLAHFTLGRKYGPDGSIAQLFYNGTPLIDAAYDALRRPAVRWTADGTVTGFEYDTNDLRMDRLATITAGKEGDLFVPVQNNRYQYDGGGNVLAYQNIAEPKEQYASWFGFSYDPANRLSAFASNVRKETTSEGQKNFAQLEASGIYTYDSGHRFKTRELTITGIPGSTFKRNWIYHYDEVPGVGPLHAPSAIDFSINDGLIRKSLFTYDDIGQMTRAAANDNTETKSPGVLTNRRMAWDAQGRLLGVHGTRDSSAPKNVEGLREDHIYDYAGNRVLKFRPAEGSEQQTPGCKENTWKDMNCEVAILYMTPFYARGLDGRGAVQIAEGDLPTATLTPSVDESEAPVVTYLYSDLAVGSATAGVTSYGEVSDAQSTVIGRREYSPFGMELTVDDLAATRRDGAAQLSVFHGKELDRTTGYSSFGARYFSRDLGIWISPDGIVSSFIRGRANGGVFRPTNLSLYAYNYQNPITLRDANGNNPGLCYSGISQVARCVDVRSGNPILDNTVLWATNQTNNAFTSFVNGFWDAMIVAGQILEPYESEIMALQSFPEGGMLLEYSALSLRTYSILARARFLPAAERLALSTAKMSQAAAAVEQGELTVAGRALQKHGMREGSAYNLPKGNPASISRSAQQIVDDILNNPASTTVTRHHARFGEITEVIAPNGRGVRYGADGKFIGFLEP